MTTIHYREWNVDELIVRARTGYITVAGGAVNWYSSEGHLRKFRSELNQALDNAAAFAFGTTPPGTDAK